MRFKDYGTLYFVQLFLDTLATSPILNFERRVENFEVGIQIRTGILLLKDLGTLYLVPGTMITTNSFPKENLHSIPNPLSKNNYFFISCSNGKFRCFGKKI
jgi:hypothetical protein